MITGLLPLAVGNAVRVTVQLPSTTVHWRVLQNATGTFAGFNDPTARIANDAEADDPLTFLDANDALINGTLAYYQAFYYDGTAWTTDEAASSVMPATTYVDDSVDAQSIVRDRLALGIAAEVARGNLTPPPNTAVIAVLTAPPVFEDTRWPVISVHMSSEAPVNRALGEEIGNDQFDSLTQLWDGHEGWHGKTQLSVIGWSLNADERIALRKAIRRVILANLAVFDAELLLQVEFSQQDIEDFSTYSAPVYETVGTFTCVTPLSVNVTGVPIEEIDVTVIPTTLPASP